jgi:hypothetical protein
VHDQRDHCEDQQQVDQSTRHVEDRETTKPRDQQNHEQYRPDTHISIPSCESILPTLRSVHALQVTASSLVRYASEAPTMKGGTGVFDPVNRALGVA